MGKGINKKVQKNKPRSCVPKKDVFRCGGTLGLQSIENGRLTRYQLEAMRRVIVKHTNRKVRISLTVVPDKAITQKPIGVRMGKGKGGIQEVIYDIRPGGLILEVSGALPADCSYILKKAGAKLPVKTLVISRLL